MKRARTFFIAPLLILTCFSLLSCQPQILLEKNETDTADDIRFVEVPHNDSLFPSMSEDNYYDVTNFSISRFDGDVCETEPIVCFSYMPRELRLLDDRAFHHNAERFSELFIDSLYAIESLETVMNIKPTRILKPDLDQANAVLAQFSKQYGIAYSFKLTHNSKRNMDDPSVVEEQTHYDFLISPKTKNNTYYLFDQNPLTLAEVDQESLSFLKTPAEDWYDCSIFEAHIGFVDKIEIALKDGTTAGVCGVTNLTLEHRSTDQTGAPLHPLDAVAAGPNAVLHVTARYHGEKKDITDITKYRKFYLGILSSTVREISFNKRRQEELKTATPDMTIKIHLKCDDQYKTLEYRFFADNSVLINGVYVGKLTNGQLDALIKATGLMLSPNAADTIDFW